MKKMSEVNLLALLVAKLLDFLIDEEEITEKISPKAFDKLQKFINVLSPLIPSTDYGDFERLKDPETMEYFLDSFVKMNLKYSHLNCANDLIGFVMYFMEMNGLNPHDPKFVKFTSFDLS
jgi:hypothetical protein